MQSASTIPPSQLNAPESKDNTHSWGLSADEEANVDECVKKLMKEISSHLEMKRTDSSDKESAVTCLNEMLRDHTNLSKIFEKIIAPEFVTDIRDVAWYDLCPMSDLKQSSTGPEKGKIYVETGNDGRLSYLDYRMLDPKGLNVTRRIRGNEFPIDELKGDDLISCLKQKSKAFLREVSEKGHAPSFCILRKKNKKNS
jgi:hypothetical protein